MYHPIPPGTRDVLPDEMLELRRIQNALLDVFGSHSFREVTTPTLEYASLLELADRRSADAAYRFFDDRGELLALRTDMTIPIARLAADRLGEVDPPHRLCYVANAYRAVTPKRGRRREFGQAGIELIGAGGASATAEVVEVLVRSLDAVGLDTAVIGLGNAGLWQGLLEDFGATPSTQQRSAEQLVNHDLVGVGSTLQAADELDQEAVDALLEVISMRGGRELLERAGAFGGERFKSALGRLDATVSALEERGISDRIQLDLGMLRDLGYYSGTTIEVYDPTVGEIIGGGGRYDGLMGKFGLDLPAAGFSLYIERIHEAQIKRGLTDA